MEFLFQLGASFRDLGEDLFVFWQEVVHVTRTGVGIMRVFQVEIEVASLDLVDGDPPCVLVFYTGFEAVGFATPPRFLGFEFLDADGFAFVIALGAKRICACRGRLGGRSARPRRCS